MSTTGNDRSGPPVRLKASTGERVASLIVALLILLAFLVLCLVAIWFGTRHAPTQAALPVRIHQEGDLDGLPGDQLHLARPERSVVGQEDEASSPQLQKTMAMLAEAIAKKAADLDQPIDDEGTQPKPGDGILGDTIRPDGPHYHPGPQWEMRYDESTLALYAQQLDFFGIELAVIGGDKERIDYASGFLRGTPTRRTGTREEEMKLRRTYFTHRSGTVQKYDLQLLAQAGINTQNRIVLQYYPHAQEETLLILQQQYRNLDQTQILKTIFGVRRKGNAFVFYVIDQVRR